MEGLLTTLEERSSNERTWMHETIHHVNDVMRTRGEQGTNSKPQIMHHTVVSSTPLLARTVDVLHALSKSTY